MVFPKNLILNNSETIPKPKLIMRCSWHPWKTCNFFLSLNLIMDIRSPKARNAFVDYRQLVIVLHDSTFKAV